MSVNVSVIRDRDRNGWCVSGYIRGQLRERIWQAGPKDKIMAEAQAMHERLALIEWDVAVSERCRDIHGSL